MTTLRPAHRGIRPALALTVLALSLTACSAPEEPAEPRSSQSRAAACAAVSEHVASAMAAFTDVDPGDPEAAAAALGEVVDGLTEARSAVSHREVGRTVAQMHDGFAGLRDAVAAAAGGDLAGAAELAAATEKISSAGADFATSCRD